jgi:hypothetical protein
MMSKERELLERWLDDTIFEPEELDSLMEETRELLAQPEEEGVYQKILKIEDGIEVEILPSELWMDGYETGRKDPPKREPLSKEQYMKFFTDTYDSVKPIADFVRLIEKAHGIEVDDESDT